ncbi:MAG: DUF6497 family protein [Sulfitobacter sp.]
MTELFTTRPVTNADACTFKGVGSRSVFGHRNSGIKPDPRSADVIPDTLGPKIVSQYFRFTGVLSTCLFLFATPALAIDVPSGQPVELQEVLVDDLGNEVWLRFRFVAPEIARETGSISYDIAESDMAFLCNSLALPYIAQYELDGQMIVISLADRETEFGQPDPDVTQFFEAYRPVDNLCIWEGL